ncbi:hypothetical protein BC828DRAFT_405978 [Blastocladiella britannica]|nr:hypothetical protein BC828DRAFT_405978 [Blastocladiella britannica]
MDPFAYSSSSDDDSEFPHGSATVWRAGDSSSSEEEYRAPVTDEFLRPDAFLSKTELDRAYLSTRAHPQHRRHRDKDQDDGAKNAEEHDAFLRQMRALVTPPDSSPPSDDDNCDGDGKKKRRRSASPDTALARSPFPARKRARTTVTTTPVMANELSYSSFLLAASFTAPSPSHSDAAPLPRRKKQGVPRSVLASLPTTLVLSTSPMASKSCPVCLAPLSKAPYEYAATPDEALRRDRRCPECRMDVADGAAHCTPVV